MTREEAEAYISQLTEVEKRILLLFIDLPSHKKQEIIDMAQEYVSEGISYERHSDF